MPSRLRQYIAIQLVPSACSRRPPPGSPDVRSKTPMLSRPRKPPSKMLLPSASLRFTHHVKLISELLEDALEERAVAAAVHLLLDLVDAHRRPRVHRRIDVAERPLVRRDLAVGVHVPLAREQEQLLLREVGIDHRERRRSGTPCPTRRTTGTPTCPASTARRRPRGATTRGCGRCGAPPEAVAAAGIAVEPALDHVAVVLLVPQHAGERLPLHVAHVVGQRERRDALVERVGLLPRSAKSVVEVGPENGCRRSASLLQPQRAPRSRPAPTART